MEYVYAAMLLHKAGKEITEESLSRVLEAAGVNVDPIRVKSLVAALEGVDIEEAIKSAALAPVAAPAPAAGSAEAGGEEKEEKKKAEEEEAKEEEALEGLASLFG